METRRSVLQILSGTAATSALAQAQRTHSQSFQTEADFVALYDVDHSITNLENAYWNVMSKPVMAEYSRRIEHVNRRNIPYVRSVVAQDSLAADLFNTRHAVARLVNAKVNEIALARCGTESLQDLISGYNKLKSGDHVIFCDLDYDAMQNTMLFLRERRGVEITTFALPEPATTGNILAAYEDVLKRTPQAAMMLVTHLCHRTGLVNPAKEIIEMARRRRVTCILDTAQAVGQLPVDMEAMNVDFAGFSLHKWVGAPLGTGAMYIRQSRLQDVDICLGNREDPGDETASRLYPGTYNFAATLTVPFAIELHEQITLERKRNRLQELRNYWVDRVRDLDGIEILTPDEPARYGATTSFRVQGMKSFEQAKSFQMLLLERYKIMTVARKGITRGAAVRVTPAFYNTTADLDKLVNAMRREHKLFS